MVASQKTPMETYSTDLSQTDRQTDTYAHTHTHTHAHAHRQTLTWQARPRFRGLIQTCIRIVCYSHSLKKDNNTALLAVSANKGMIIIKNIFKTQTIKTKARSAVENSD